MSVLGYGKKVSALCITAVFLSTAFSGMVSAEAGKTRSISMTLKSAKGGQQNFQLYDYTAALIIGIDRYTNLSATQQLTYAIKDAKGIEKVLRENYQFNEIKTLYNEEATRENIINALYGLRTVSPDAGVFVYFAGHGITMSGMIGGKDLGYLIPHDGSLVSEEMGKNISMQQIKSDISSFITAKHVFFVFDACFAGLMLDTRSAMVAPTRDLAYLKSITQEQVRQVLTAGAKGQTVLDGGPGGHSVFTGRFIQILEGVEDYITARELGQKLKKQVYGDAMARGHEQRPVDGEIYGTGDFVFVPDLDKRNRDMTEDITKLEQDMARLKRMKEEAGRAKDEEGQRKLEQERLAKEAELKLARIRKQQNEDAVRRQKQAESEARADAQEQKRREKESETRLAMLRVQAEKMRKELGGDITGGATLSSAVSELKRTKKQRDDIEERFIKEERKQTQEITAFYDKKIARLSDSSPWDKEFETKADYNGRIREAETKAAPARKEKQKKLVALRKELAGTRDSQIIPLEKQLKTLKGKRFTMPASGVSFKFTSYKLNAELMLGALTLKGETLKFYCPIPKKKARGYKKNPDLLVPEVVMKATLYGQKLDRIIFHGPENGENYTALPYVDISDDGRFVDNGDGTVNDTRTGLMWASKDNGRDINWQNANSYAESYKGGGYTDWRLPTQDELAGIYDKSKKNRHGYRVTRLIGISDCCSWASETSGSEAADFDFYSGDRHWYQQSYSRYKRSLPVRFGN